MNEESASAAPAAPAVLAKTFRYRLFQKQNGDRVEVWDSIEIGLDPEICPEDKLLETRIDDSFEELVTAATEVRAEHDVMTSEVLIEDSIGRNQEYAYAITALSAQ